MARFVALVLISAAWLAGHGPALSKDEPPSTVGYWHNWTDNDGVSHLTRCDFRDFKLESMAPPADPLWLNSQSAGDAKLITVVKPPKWKGYWHSDKKVLWAVTLAGKWFVEAMDDTRAELGAGDIVLVENVKGPRDDEGREGHLSGNIGEEVVKIMVVELDQMPELNRPCRFK